MDNMKKQISTSPHLLTNLESFRPVRICSKDLKGSVPLTGHQGLLNQDLLQPCWWINEETAASCGVSDQAK